MAGRAGRRASAASEFDDDRPPEPPPPLPGVSQRSRHSSEGGRGRSEHNIPDEGLSGIVGPVRAKVPRESSPTPAARMPGGRDGRPDRSPSGSRPGSAGRNGRRESPRRHTSSGSKTRPPPPLPPSASKASKSPPPASSGSEQRTKSPMRMASSAAEQHAKTPPPPPPSHAGEQRSKSPPPPPSYAGEQGRERSRSPSQDERRAPRENRGTSRTFPSVQPTSSPTGSGSHKGPPGKASPLQRQRSVNDRLSGSYPVRPELIVDPPLLVGDTPVEPEDLAETADSSFYRDTTDDDRSWAGRASLGSVASPTEAAASVASRTPPKGMGGFDFGTWPILAAQPVALPGPAVPVPGFVAGMAPMPAGMAPMPAGVAPMPAGVAPMPGFLSPPRGAPRALVPPLPLGSAVDLSPMARGAMKSPLRAPALLSPTAKLGPFPMHSLSLDSSMLSAAPVTPMRTPSVEFRAVPPPLTLVQLGQPAWTPESPQGALRSGRARSSSPMRSSRSAGLMRTDSRTLPGDGAKSSTAPLQQMGASPKAPMAIPLRNSAQRLPLPFQQFRPPRVRSMSPRPVLGPARRQSHSPLPVRGPLILPHPKAFPWVPAVQPHMRRPHLQVNGGFAPMLATRSMSPLQPRMRGPAWSSPMRGGGVVRVGSPLRTGVLSPPRSPSPSASHRAVAVPSSPAGMLPYAGAGARQNMYASTDSLGEDYPSGPSSVLPEQAASAEHETAYPRSPTGSPRLEVDEPLQPHVKAGSLQRAEEDFMRRWRDLQSTDGEDEQEAFVADSPSNKHQKATIASTTDHRASALPDNVLEAAGKRRGTRQRIRSGQPAQRRVGR